MPGSHVFDRYAPFTDVAALVEASSKPLRKSKRVNLLKSSVEKFKVWAKEKEWMIEPVPWCSEGFYIDREDREVALGKDLLHLLGHTYMQEAASMMPVALLDPQPGETILDMSAAPGSKTTQIAGRMGEPFDSAQGRVLRPRGVIVANDVQEKRLWTLKSSLHRSGVTNVIVTKKVGQWFMRHMTERFDRVLCDAPCTAQGTSRKDSDALLYSSEENVGKMARLQRELLEAAIHAAKVGGVIVYSTCTLTPEENEGVVGAILQKFAGQVEALDPRECGQRSAASGQNGYDCSVAIKDSMRVQQWLADRSSLIADCFPAIRLWPHTFDTEGFFVSVMRKKAPTCDIERQDWVRLQEERLPRNRQREVEAIIAEMYGSPLLLEGETLFERGTQLILTNEETGNFGLPVSDYSLGLPVARRLDEHRIRIDHDLATLRGNLATKSAMVLDEAALDLLLDGKDASADPALRGDMILRYHDISVGLSLAKEGKLWNRLPRWIVLKS